MFSSFPFVCFPLFLVFFSFCSLREDRICWPGISKILLQSLICRALLPRVTRGKRARQISDCNKILHGARSPFARVAAFKQYSVVFMHRIDRQYCVARTWDENNLQSICVRVEASGQRVPRSELSCLSGVIDVVNS